MKKNRVGEIFKTNNYGKCTVVDYEGFDRITVKFEDGTLVEGVTYSCLKKGQVRNPNLPMVSGIGYEGQGKYSKKDHPTANKIWSGILYRCYSNNDENPTYKNCSVSKEWHNFQNFAEWYENNYIEGWEIDKDILVKGNKIYGPDTCCFVPKNVNLFFSLRKNNTGLPVGVWRHKDKYRAYCRYNKKRYHLGLFETVEEASKAYKIQKNKLLLCLIEEYRNKLPEKVIKALMVYKF